MKQTPFEYVVRHGLPVLRKEIARCMINDFGLNEKEAAEKLGITPAAVFQYLSGKRGKINVTDVEVLHKINISTERIVNQGDGTVVSEICRLCKFFSSKRLFPFTSDSCKDESYYSKRRSFSVYYKFLFQYFFWHGTYKSIG